MTKSAEALRAKIDAGSAVVGVIGLGYVGLPLSLTFAESGFRVIGFDIDGEKVQALNRGDTYIENFQAERVRRVVDSGHLEATTDFDRLDEPDALLICVPTPLTADLEPDLGFVSKTTAQIAKRLRPAQLVVLESTTYPGTTEEILKPALEAGGLVCGRDFFLAYSPERENPGDDEHTTATIPKVVGGLDPIAGDLAEALYDRVVVRVVRVSTARVAEATKLTENVFRSVNIALVNELKVIFRDMGVDVWEVIDAASTKPFGFMRFEPGPGWGGHCVPIDPYYLAWRAKRAGQEARFVELAGEINRQMPEYVVERAREVIEEGGGDLSTSRILIVGLAFKPNVADDRESPSYRLMDRLSAAGADVSFHDPFIPVIHAGRAHGHWAGHASVDLDAETIASFDLVIISTRHDGVDYPLLARHARAILDTRNAMSGVDVPEARVWSA